LHPTLLHDDASFTLLGVMGGGAGDAHASVSVLTLSADGRMQNGLTRTVVSPVTLVASPEGAGYMGESLGVAQADGILWAAATDNASGECHVALVQVR
jgi:hypothetical protein